VDWIVVDGVRILGIFAIVRRIMHGSMRNGWLGSGFGSIGDCYSGPVGARLACAVPLCVAHVSHSTLLVSCRLSFFFPLSRLLLLQSVEIIRRRRPQRERESRAPRKFGLDIVGWWRQTGDY